jgi:hypothetical protein
MKKTTINENLNSLKGSTIEKVTEENGQVSIVFSNKTKVTAAYWRVVRAGMRISNFDQDQKYGLQTEIKAVEELGKIISGEHITAANLEGDTGDLEFIMGDKKLRLFNFTGYEVWEINFPDGTGEYSNYV